MKKFHWLKHNVKTLHVKFPIYNIKVCASFSLLTATVLLSAFVFWLEIDSLLLNHKQRAEKRRYPKVVFVSKTRLTLFCNRLITFCVGIEKHEKRRFYMPLSKGHMKHLI